MKRPCLRRCERRAPRLVLFCSPSMRTRRPVTKMTGPLQYQPEVLHFADEAAAANDSQPADFEPARVLRRHRCRSRRSGSHRPHNLNGIEIYKGKPIFYSLGSLILPLGERRTFTTAAGETLTIPDEAFETVIPALPIKTAR